MAIQKQYARKKRKREQSKLRSNKQCEEIFIEKKQAYQIHRDEKVQQQKVYNEKNCNKVNARQRIYDEKHRDEKAE